MPRLAKGQVAAGVRRKSAACKESTLCRIGILKKLLSGEKSALRSLAHFKSLGALCTWESLDDGITPIDPKTLKSYVNELYKGGYESFSLDAAKVTNSMVSRGNLDSPKSKVESQNRAGAVLLATQRYSDLLDRLKKLAVSSEDARRELSKHFRLFGDVPSHLRQVK